jgi:hypothetical protein
MNSMQMLMVVAGLAPACALPISTALAGRHSARLGCANP